MSRVAICEARPSEEASSLSEVPSASQMSPAATCEARHKGDAPSFSEVPSAAWMSSADCEALPSGIRAPSLMPVQPAVLYKSGTLLMLGGPCIRSWRDLVVTSKCKKSEHGLVLEHGAKVARLERSWKEEQLHEMALEV